MALQLSTEAGVIKIPGAYVLSKVQSTPGGLGLTGVVALIGESSLGVPFGSEVDLAVDAAFGPDQYTDVQAKYGDGPLVDAFREVVAAANDPDILGAAAQIVMVKTNSSVASSATLLNVSSGTWATLAASKPGSDGNLIARTVTAAASEVIPTTGAFTLLVPIANTDINFRVNGGAAVAYTMAAAALPPAIVSGIDALSGVAATGGADRGIIGSVSGTLALTVVSGNAVTLTRSVAWSVTPTVGDTVYVSSTSVVAGGSSQNVGSYVVTAATSTTISATKLLDASGTPNQLTTPVTVGAQTIASTTADARAFAPVTVSLEAGSVSDGLGKSLEVAELSSASGRLSYVAYAKNTSVVSWISKTGAATNLASATEYEANLNVARQKDSLSEDLAAGGGIALQIGYAGTTASAVIASGVLTITVAGGSGSSPAAIKLADYSTIADLVAYLNTLTGFTAAAGSATIGQQPSTSLDEGTFTFGSTWGAKNGRIKQDAFAMKKAIAASSNVKLTGTLPVSGLPATATAVFMTGGARGASADSDFTNALTALESVDCNFVVPLISNDATTDISDGLTDSASSYTVDGVNAATRSHVIKMSTLKNYKPRQAFLSHRGVFTADMAAASNTASFRCAMTFQDVRTNGSTGSVVQQRPWMGAVKAAGFQAAAFRKSIYAKGVNIVGAVKAQADFNSRASSDVEKALSAGLLVLRPAAGGGWEFVSDQTTYTKDDSFFFNSIQAVYVGDVIGRTLQQRLQKAIVGQSVADFGRSQGLAVLRQILDDLRDLRLIAPSDDAPKGYINEDVKIKAPTVYVSVSVREATSLAFVLINLAISAVSQTG